jgi:MFS family permease
MNAVRRLKLLSAEYPRTYWILFWGSLVNSSGGSMVWPFLTIYLRDKLDIPLTTVTLLLTVQSGATLVSTFFAGPFADRFGRRGVMLIGMFVNSLVYIGMILASNLQSWIILMALAGAFNPIYRVGSDAVVADIIPPERRPNAYALLRMIINLGITIGPAVGGFIAAVSYSYVFGIAAFASFLFAMLILLKVPETMPTIDKSSRDRQSANSRGYGQVLRDKAFISFCGIYTLAGMAYIMYMVLLPVYAKENYGVVESQYGFIMATNAAMVVLFQYLVTNITQRYSRLMVLATGALFCAIGVGSVALGQGFAGFLISMVSLTIGEMIMMPTSTALTADLAPADMRGRYMSLYGLTFGIGVGIGPVIGGVLNDRVSPQAIWYGGMLLALASSLGFVLLARSVLSKRISAHT